MSADISTREGLFAVMRQIAAEREAAKPLVAELLAREEIPWDEDIPEEWRTAGFVEELTKAAAGMLERDPQRCLDLLFFAIPLACTATKYPPLVVAYHIGTAWRHLGYGHWYAASHEQSLRLSRAAERAFSNELSLVHDVTTASFGRAGVLAFMHRFEDGAKLLDSCEAAFEEFGDRKRVVRCQIARANFDYCRGDFAGARSKLKAVLDIVREQDDLHTLGVVLNNLGHICARVGRLDEGEDALRQARDLYVRLQMPLEIDRIDWGVGVIHLARGEAAEALSIFNRVRNHFLEQQIIDNAGRVGLDAVDALLVLGRNDEARRVAEQVADEFRYANVSPSALQAVTYLRDFLPSGNRARAVVHHVRSFIEGPDNQRPQVFVPPADDEST